MKLLKYFIVFCIVTVASSDKNEPEMQENIVDQKSLSKRGIHSVGISGHPYEGLYHTDYTIPPFIPFHGKHFVNKPTLVAPQPNFPIVHGGATVTSYSSNYPQFRYHQKPLHHIPISIFKPTFVPAVYPSSFSPFYANSIPNNPSLFQHKPIIPIAVPFSS